MGALKCRWETRSPGTLRWASLESGFDGDLRHQPRGQHRRERHGRVRRASAVMAGKSDMARTGEYVR